MDKMWLRDSMKDVLRENNMLRQTNKSRGYTQVDNDNKRIMVVSNNRKKDNRAREGGKSAASS